MRLRRLSLPLLALAVLGVLFSGTGAAGAAPAPPKVIILRIGTGTAQVGDEARSLDAPPVVMNGRTMVPLRFIAEALGLTVRWDGETQSIVLAPAGIDANSVPIPTLLGGVGNDKYIANAQDFTRAADWSQATTVRLDLAEMSFTPKDLTFEAGKPYKLEIHNAGQMQHEVAASQFFRSVALRQAEDKAGQYVMPYLNEAEVAPRGQLNLYFVPLLPGHYDLSCNLPGHREAGMTGSITVTGATPATAPLQVANMADATAVPDAADRVKGADWKNAQTVNVELGEMYFKPDTITLQAGQPYRIHLSNTGQLAHEVQAANFFPTAAVSKAQDAISEVKGPTFREIQLLPGAQTDLYLIPTTAGSFEVACHIAGHYEAGMHGTIVVQ